MCRHWSVASPPLSTSFYKCALAFLLGSMVRTPQGRPPSRTDCLSHSAAMRSGHRPMPFTTRSSSVDAAVSSHRTATTGMPSTTWQSSTSCWSRSGPDGHESQPAGTTTEGKHPSNLTSPCPLIPCSCSTASSCYGRSSVTSGRSVSISACLPRRAFDAALPGTPICLAPRPKRSVATPRVTSPLRRSTEARLIRKDWRMLSWTTPSPPIPSCFAGHRQEVRDFSDAPVSAADPARSRGHGAHCRRSGIPPRPRHPRLF